MLNRAAFVGGLLLLNVILLVRVSHRLDAALTGPAADILIFESLDYDYKEAPRGDAPALIGVISPAQPSLAQRFLRAAETVGRHGRVDVVVIGNEKTVGALSGSAVPSWARIVVRGNEAILAALKYNKYKSRWTVLNANGDLTGGSLSGVDIDAGVRAVLGTGSLMIDSPEIKNAFEEMFIRGDLPISSRKPQRADGERQFLVLADIIQTACPLVDVITEVDRLPALVDDVAFAVSDRWTPDEIMAVQETLDLRLPVQRLSAAASSEWRRLTAQFGPLLEGGVMVIFRGDSVDEVIIGASPIVRYLRSVAVAGQ